MDLSRSEIIKDFNINFHPLGSKNVHPLNSENFHLLGSKNFHPLNSANFHSLSSENFHPLNTITRIKF